MIPKKYQVVKILNVEMGGMLDRLANRGVEADVIYAALLFMASLIRDRQVRKGVDPGFFDAADATVVELLSQQVSSDAKLMLLDGGKA